MKKIWYDVTISFRKREAGETTLPVDKIILTDSLYEGESEEIAKTIFNNIVDNKIVSVTVQDVGERLKWWKNNLQYKAPEQLRDCLNAMFKEFLG